MWSVNPENGLIDVKGSVEMTWMSLTKIPILFGHVTGNFDCSNNYITNLIGAPQFVGGNFFCHYNELNSLENAPKYTGGSFYCHNNKLTTLIGASQSVGGRFYCSNNPLTSLEGAPQSVKGTFDINLGKIDYYYQGLIILQIEEMIERGIEIGDPDNYYYPYKEIYYKNKLIELL
jgi:hypothetical protein